MKKRTRVVGLLVMGGAIIIALIALAVKQWIVSAIATLIFCIFGIFMFMKRKNRGIKKGIIFLCLYDIMFLSIFIESTILFKQKLILIIGGIVLIVPNIIFMVWRRKYKVPSVKRIIKEEEKKVKEEKCIEDCYKAW